MKRKLLWAGLIAGVALASHLVFGQRQRDRNSYNPNEEGWMDTADTVKTAREMPSHSSETPMWTNAPGFDKDVFTFARVRYTRKSRGGAIWWKAGYWYSDAPDSDLNLSYRLQQLTSIKVNPNGRIIDITDPELFSYPWIYMVEPGLMDLEEDEVPILRKFLLNGGFMMADDFWGDPQWANFEREMKKVFPDREFTELPADHPIFHSVYDLDRSENKMQVPNVAAGRRAEQTGITWETNHRGEGNCKDLHIRALFDDKGRIMVLACHNTDYGDGWEREGEDVYFFHRFAENIAYPFAVNIIVYAMTH